MTPIIDVKNLSFSYPGGNTALNNINLEIAKGEIIAIIGQNGSGKTTLVKHFNGLLLPTKGRVLVEGQTTDLKTVAQLSKTVGYVFQNPDDQIFNNKVYDEVSFGPENMGIKNPELKKRVNEALEIVGISDIKNKHPMDLDLNQKKLVVIASMISMNPQVLILDEPTTGQDHAGLVYVEKLINRLKENHTVIIISHDMNLVARVANRAIMLLNGKKIFDGNPREAFLKTDLLKKTYLKPPIITELAQSIKGFKRDILTVDEFMEELERLRKKKR